ncbi:ent-cassadiene c2-hydroxylase-like protein [Lasius niger]|uniref:Ent-cassadiene c2-hydroxylase-like protein n=1 Tax=Lasius niger TaxID=67767 RepID=A0A0J7JYV0_LASNI|nr:ent-cassadiene c2-hydroxylase-like protein [Lasius niger]
MVYFLKEKSETAKKVAEMLQVVKNQRGQPVKIFQCDGGLEFDNSEVRKLMTSNGVTLAITNPYTTKWLRRTNKQNSSGPCSDNALSEKST